MNNSEGHQHHRHHHQKSVNSDATEKSGTRKRNRKDEDKSKTKAKAKRERTTNTDFQFDINQQAMSGLATSCVDPELKCLGVASYNQNDYEQGVIKQLEKAIEKCGQNENVAQEENINDSNGDPNDYYYEEDDETGVDHENYDDDDDDENYQPDESDIEECFDDDIDQFEEAPETSVPSNKKKRKKRSRVELGNKRSKSKDATLERRQIQDDGDENTYKKRLAEYRLLQAQLNRFDADEQYHTVCGPLKIPVRIWDRLFEHQRECLRWLWELHVNLCGGIIGDEMGLGKTIQVIAFLIALKCTKYREVCHLYSSLGPVLLVCPATVMHQWVSELHSWWPTFRVAVLHQTGTYQGTDKKKLIRDIFKAGGILITSYNSMCNYSDELSALDWHYVVLDEGHKIRNPDALVTHCCKLVKTPHRLILSGSPIQNNLRELWSLFDFINPGKLGPLSTFMDTVANPIRRGGYANATNLEIQIAYKCTCMLRDVIKPNLLRRTKEDIKMSLALPAKNEQVLFCKLTDKQRDLYLRFLDTDVVRNIHQGQAQVFAALVKIRKICNHPFLFDHYGGDIPLFDANFFRQSGKMEVVHALLKLWYKQKHKVLLFTQSRQMLDLLESYAKLRKYDYLRMDGQTSMATRQALIHDFNTNSSRFLFLLTTKVGGIGVNLTGANRVIIYDPDWNPATDIQARERCWRIGQNRDVIIYRLLSAGSVEEKIYHRQIFKQYLTNSVLKNPNHRRFFKMNNLRELFALNDINQTSEMFSDSKVKLKRKPPPLSSTSEPQRKLPKIPKVKPISGQQEESSVPQISSERQQELRDQAKRSSQMIAAKFAAPNETHQEIRSPEPSSSSVFINAVQSELSKSNKKHANEGIVFEGVRITHLVGQETFEHKEKKRKKKKRSESEAKQEDYILHSLLGNTLDSVLRHDSIENVNIPDHHYLEQEAEKVAKEALKSLQRNHNDENNSGSPQTRSNVQFFHGGLNRSSIIATSTASTSSVASNPGMSSADVIAAIKARKARNEMGSGGGGGGSVKQEEQKSFFAGPTSTPMQSSDSTTSRTAEHNALMHKLRDFIHHGSARPNEATSSEILAHFNGQVPPERCSIFKSMLHKLCHKVTSEDGQLVWRLKSEFH